MPQLHSMQRAHVGLQTITCTLLLLASLVGLTIVKSQVQIFSLGEQGPDARTFPILALGLLALAAFSRIVVNRRRTDVSVGPASSLVKVIFICTAMAAAFALMPVAGFLACAGFVGIVTSFVFGERRVIYSVGLTLLIAALVNFGAKHALNIPLP